MPSPSLAPWLRVLSPLRQPAEEGVCPPGPPRAPPFTRHVNFRPLWPPSSSASSHTAVARKRPGPFVSQAQRAAADTEPGPSKHRIRRGPRLCWGLGKQHSEAVASPHVYAALPSTPPLHLPGPPCPSTQAVSLSSSPSRSRLFRMNWTQPPASFLFPLCPPTPRISPQQRATLELTQPARLTPACFLPSFLSSLPPETSLFVPSGPNLHHKKA